MKKLIRKILSQKKLGITVIVLFLMVICSTVYTLVGVRKSIDKMAQATETVTYFPKYPSVNTTGRDPELVKRGEYLAKAGDCMACHTNTAIKEKAQPFAGGLAMDTPFGTIYAPNITPDKETGIGNWTEDQFIKAMREGISPKGHYYYPAFPYLYFSKVSTDDLKAIKAYLDSIPAVSQKNRKNEMVWPFNIRFLQLGWRVLFFYKEAKTVPNNPEQTPEVNRGAYLAEGLGHCAMCHSPSYHILSESLPLGAPIHKYDLTGAKVQGFLAPNISETNLSKVPVDEVVDVFTKNKLIGGGNVEGPMLEVNEDSLKYLSPADLNAIAVYLKSVQSELPPKPKAGSGGIGKSIYDTYCSGCHANGAGSAPKYGDPAAWEPVMKDGIDKVYNNAIHGIGGMPAKGTCISCSDDEIKQSVDYMVAAIEGRKVISVPKPKVLTVEDGKRIYETNCAVCHNTGFKNAPKPGDIEAWKPMVAAGFLKTLENVVAGRHGHLPRGACPECSDAELKAAVKYMMQESTTSSNYNLW